MTNQEISASAEQDTVDASVLRKVAAFNAASYRFNEAIASLRTTMIAADKAPGTPFFPAGDVTREEARDLHARWVSASCVMHEAVDDVTSRGAALIRAAEALFSP